MNADYIIKRCESYIDDWNSNPEHAIMITGEWGCGKTFFANNIVRTRNDRLESNLAWKISLFGAKTTEDLDDRLFEAAHPIVGDKKAQKWLSIGYNLIRGAAKYKYGKEIQGLMDSVFETLNNKDSAPEGCQVLFVDDVERASMKIEDIFAYFAPIINGGTRVVFIANETELMNKKDNKDVYMNIKEKTIGETYLLEPDYNAALDSFCSEIWGLESNEKAARKEQLLDIVKLLDIKNLRIIRQVIYQWKLFHSQLLEEWKTDNEYIGQLFEEFVVLAINCKQGSVAGQYGNEVGDSHDNTVKEMKEQWNQYNECKRKHNNKILEAVDLKESLISGYLTYPLRHAELWPYILLYGKDADGEWMKEKFSVTYQAHQEILKAKRDSRRNIEKLKKLTFFQSNNIAESIEELFGKVVQEFDEGMYVRFDEIILYLQIYLTLMHGGVLPIEFDYSTLAKQLKKFLRNYKSKISALPAFEHVQREKVIPGLENKEINACIDEIFNVAMESTGKTKQQILHQKDYFLEYISRPDHAITDWVNVPFLEQVDIDEVFCWLGDDLVSHRNLLKFLEYRYRKVFEEDKMMAVDFPDLPHVKKLLERYEGRCGELAHKFRLDYRDYNEIKNKYKALLDYMNCQYKEAKRPSSSC